MNYEQKLQQCKSNYPFANWRKMFDRGLVQYTEENCDKAKDIFDELISNLITSGENAPEEQKVTYFEEAVLALNDLNDEQDGALIETGEREELCELIDQITVASGLDPDNFGDGGGIADEWRDW